MVLQAQSERGAGASALSAVHGESGAVHLTLPITAANIRAWFPAAAAENPLAGEAWWQLQGLGLLAAIQILRLVPPGGAQQQAFIELRRCIDTALLAVPTPPDEEIQRRMAQTLAPWAPTPFDVVEEMLTLADIRPGERLLDLGCGDGRIVFAAARRGARARGIDVDGAFVAQCRERKAEDRLYTECEFEQALIEQADWGTPDVVTCYLLSASMDRLEQKFRQMRSGTRIISHGFSMSRWEPTRSVRIGDSPLYLWTV